MAVKTKTLKLPMWGIVAVLMLVKLTLANDLPWLFVFSPVLLAYGILLLGWALTLLAALLAFANIRIDEPN